MLDIVPLQIYDSEKSKLTGASENNPIRLSGTPIQARLRVNKDNGLDFLSLLENIDDQRDDRVFH